MGNRKLSVPRALFMDAARKNKALLEENNKLKACLRGMLGDTRAFLYAVRPHTNDAGRAMVDEFLAVVAPQGEGKPKEGALVAPQRGTNVMVFNQMDLARMEASGGNPED